MPSAKTTAPLSVLVMFGGRSPEHDVSIVTGQQVAQALDPSRYKIIPLYIAADGKWWTGPELLQRSFFIPSAESLKKLTSVVLDTGSIGKPRLLSTRPGLLGDKTVAIDFDIALPAFHGLYGEDGGIQGLLEVANIPYTGARVMASSVFMDKAATKRYLHNAGIPVLPFIEIHRPERGMLMPATELASLFPGLEFPAIVKPSHLGSSIGVAKVTNYEELSAVLPGVFRFDHTAIIEPFVSNLVEYNIAVRRSGNHTVTSAIERPKTSAELLDFKEKYLSNGGGKKGVGAKQIPAAPSQGMLSLTRDINPALPADLEANIRHWATLAFDTAYGSGSPRLDFICNGQSGEIWLNEINPCPGSFAFFLWEAAKDPVLFTDLLDQMLEEAQTLHRQKRLPPDPTPEDARLFRRL